MHLKKLETEGSEFGSEIEDDKMEGDDDEEGDEMEEDEGEDDGDWRFEKVDGERSTPTREVEIVDMDSNEPVSQELPRLKDCITHHSNANNNLLPSSPPTISNPASMQHGTEPQTYYPPLLLMIPYPLHQLRTQLLRISCQVITM